MKKKKILIADDDRNIVELIRINLEQKAYKVTSAYDGMTAFRKIRLGKPDLVILDILMPMMDGFTLDQELGDEENTKRIPVIIITGNPALKKLFEKTGQPGTRVVFDKPFNVRKLIDKVDESLRAGVALP